MALGKLLLISFALLSVSVGAGAAQTLNDSAILSTDPTFIARVHVSAIKEAEVIALEGVGVTNHANRDSVALAVLSDSTNRWAQLFTNAVAAVSTVVGAADANGATPLVPNNTTCTNATPAVCTTTGNLSAQAALITDAQINSAISGGWNVFTPQ